MDALFSRVPCLIVLVDLMQSSWLSFLGFLTAILILKINLGTYHNRYPSI